MLYHSGDWETVYYAELPDAWFSSNALDLSKDAIDPSNIALVNKAVEEFNKFAKKFGVESFSTNITAARDGRLKFKLCDKTKDHTLIFAALLQHDWAESVGSESRYPQTGVTIDCDERGELIVMQDCGLSKSEWEAIETPNELRI